MTTPDLHPAGGLLWDAADWMKAYETRNFQPSQDGHLAAEAHVAGLGRRFPGVALRLGRAAVIQALDEHTRACLLYQPVPQPLSHALRTAWRILNYTNHVRPVKCNQTWERAMRQDPWSIRLH